MDILGRNRQNYRKEMLSRYIETGISGFLDHEIIELLLSFTITNRDVRPLAIALLKKYGDVSTVLDAPIRELVTMRGIDIRTAALVKFARDCSEHFIRHGTDSNVPIKYGQDFIESCMISMSELKEEKFYVAILNTLSEITNIEAIQAVTSDNSGINSRNVIERALSHGAVSLVFIRYYPDISNVPSHADSEMAKLLVAEASLMDIEVLDYIIIGGSNYFSFKESGLLEDP